MDGSKFCRSNLTQSSGSNSPISCNINAVNCGTNQSASSLSCKNSHQKSSSNKPNPTQRGTTTATTTATTTRSNLDCSAGSSSGNYINMISVPIGTLSYHRRKLVPQEYQSRLIYNTSDHRGDEYLAVPNSIRSGSIPLQTWQPHQHQVQEHSQQSLQNTSNFSQPLPGRHQPSGSNSNAVEKTVDEAVSCNLEGICHMLATSQSYQTGNASEQMLAPAVSLGTVTVPGPPVMYTVHRVITTAQIQTATGNTFASSSSVSSIVSSVRNDGDSMALSNCKINNNNECLTSNGNALNNSANMNLMPDSVNGTPSKGPENDDNINGESNNICRSTGGNANPNFVIYQNCNAKADGKLISRPTQSNCTSANPVCNIKYVGRKKSAPVSRSLENVIPTCVYLMSRIAVHMEIEGTAQCPTQVMLAAALGCEELGIANKLLAQSIFGLWMTSSLFEIQLKSHHRPYVIRMSWAKLLEKYSHGNTAEKKFDEPMIILKRNVFLSRRDEEKIKDHRILELLYEEAKHNVLCGRYIMEPVHFLMLGGIQARIELGPYNSHTHTISFFRDNQSRFLPAHVAKSSSWSWLPVSRKNSAEIKLLEQFKRVPQSATTRKLIRKYLEFCWALPFYGAAFFHGQIEEPFPGILSFVNNTDIEVIVAINERGVFIIDPCERTLLLGLRYEELSWDFGKPSACEDSECLTCIFLQFDVMDNGLQMSKLIQIFSKQAPLIDALISHFVEQIKKRKQNTASCDLHHDEPNPIQSNGNGVLCNKLSRLTLATFDEEGRCLNQMGSLSISY